MPIGARIGPRIGPRVNPRVGSNVGNPLDTVARDETSLIYCPANAAQWSAVLAAAGITSGGPSALYLFQEASGNPADSIGSFTLTATGVMTYRTAVTGWTRKGIAWADGGNATLISTSASLPNVSTASMLSIGYHSFTVGAPEAIRNAVSHGTTVHAARINTTPRMTTVAGATVAGTANPTDNIMPVVLRTDRTNTLANVYTKQEKISTANLTGVTGKRIGWGGIAVLAPAQTLMYAAVFMNAAAELSDAQVKTLLQTLGWTIPWS